MGDSCACLTEINRGFQRNNGHIRVIVDAFHGCEVPKLKVDRIDRARPAPQPHLQFCAWCGTRYAQVAAVGSAEA